MQDLTATQDVGLAKILAGIGREKLMIFWDRDLFIQNRHL